MLSYVKVAEMTIKTAKSNSSNVSRLVGFYACYSLCAFAPSPNLVPRVSHKRWETLGTRLPIPAPTILAFREVADVNRLRKCILRMGANLWHARPRRMTTMTSLANLLKHSRGCGNKANRKNKQSLRYNERRFEMPDFRRNFAAVQNIPAEYSYMVGTAGLFQVGISASYNLG